MMPEECPSGSVGTLLFDSKPAEKAMRDRQNTLAKAKANIRIGTRAKEIRANQPLMNMLRGRREIESSSGIEEWLYFPDGFTIAIRNGTVVTIYR